MRSTESGGGYIGRSLVEQFATLPSNAGSLKTIYARGGSQVKDFSWAVPFPQRGEDSEQDSSYWEAWIHIGEIFGGGACAAAYAPEESDRWVLIVGYLREILKIQVPGRGRDPYALNFLACCYADGTGVERNLTMARQGFLDAGNLGLSVAWFNLGRLYCRGKEPNYKRAVKIFVRGSEMGCTFCGRKLQDFGA